ncbi:MAG: type IX secretion system membrane protein PorP/SprF [Bacteroidia bacterium]|nr:type IX secretion system membrane protein PorP/SprF [Bacteroidia bacterium]
MAKLYKFLIVVMSIGLAFESNSVKAQDPIFTQFYANPLYLNPAFAGSVRCPRFVLNYRNQWPNLYKTYITYAASYDQHIEALSGGIGLMVYNDRAGNNVINSTAISGIYSYQLNVTRNLTIRAGLQATYMQKALDGSKLTFGDMIDQRNGFIFSTAETDAKSNITKSYPDFSAGLLAYSKKYFVGIAAHHLTQPNEGFISGSKLPTKITAHAGVVIPVGDRNSETSISPNILFQKQQNFQQLNIGLYANKGPIVGGIWYRNQDAFIVTIGIQQSLFKIGYSYDATISKLANATAGAHEVSTSFQLPCKPKKKKFRTISCPSF